MTADTLDEASELRHRLASELEHAGHIRSPEWRAAVEDVRRHEFLPAYFARSDSESGPTLWTPVHAEHADAKQWLAQTYTDDSYVTQLDGHLAPSDAYGPVTGIPTSSSTMPSLVARMWEDLDVHDGHRVLEIGTGTGYSTALGCHRLGHDNMTSVEVDPEVAANARQALDRAGYHPHLVVGDGLAGAPERAPYDRIIATCSLRHVPTAWIEQSKPGTVILVTLSGWLGGTGLAKLTVTGPDSAEGGFLPGYVSFMPARAHTPEPVLVPDLTGPTTSRSTAVGSGIISTYGTAQLVVQLALPDAQHLQLGLGAELPEDLLVLADGSYAAVSREADHWTVRQGGPQRPWDQVEAAVLGWREAGEPEIDRFTIEVTPDEQTVRLPSGSARWRLPV